jgi:hypothetical protein
MILGYLQIGLVAALACACSKGNGEATDSRTRPVDPPAPSVATPPAAPDGLARAKARAEAALAAASPSATAEVRVLDGPGGTQIVRAVDPAAYPGTGVAALIYDPATDKTYGKRGEASVARLVQERGWLDQRLPDADLIRLVHEARFDGLLMLGEASVEAADAGGLRVRLPVHGMDGAATHTWLVTLPAAGDEAVERAAP